MPKSNIQLNFDQAVSEGDTTRALKLLAEGAILSFGKTVSSNTFLMALKQGHFELFKALLQTLAPQQKIGDSLIFTLAAIGHYRRIDSNSPFLAYFLEQRIYERFTESGSNLTLYSWYLSAALGKTTEIERVTFSPEEVNALLYFATAADQLDCVKTLIKKGADCEAALSPNHLYNALTIAIASGYLRTVQYFIEEIKINPNQSYNIPTTTSYINPPKTISSLAIAATYGHINIVQYLIHQGATIDLSTIENNPIYLAARNKHNDIITYLLQQPPSVTIHSDAQQRHSMSEIAISGTTDLEFLRFLTQEISSDATEKKLPRIYGALLLSIRKNNTTALQYLLQNKNKPLPDKMNYLVCVAAYHSFLFPSLVCLKNDFLAKQPLDAFKKMQATISVPNNTLQKNSTTSTITGTPLFCAAKGGNKQAMDLLLDFYGKEITTIDLAPFYKLPDNLQSSFYSRWAKAINSYLNRGGDIRAVPLLERGFSLPTNYALAQEPSRLQNTLQLWEYLLCDLYPTAQQWIEKNVCVLNFAVPCPDDKPGTYPLLLYCIDLYSPSDLTDQTAIKNLIATLVKEGVDRWRLGPNDTHIVKLTENLPALWETLFTPTQCLFKQYILCPQSQKLIATVLSSPFQIADFEVYSSEKQTKITISGSCILPLLIEELWILQGHVEDYWHEYLSIQQIKTWIEKYNPGLNHSDIKPYQLNTAEADNLKTIVYNLQIINSLLFQEKQQSEHVDTNRSNKDNIIVSASFFEKYHLAPLSKKRQSTLFEFYPQKRRIIDAAQESPSIQDANAAPLYSYSHKSTGRSNP